MDVVQKTHQRKKQKYETKQHFLNSSLLKQTKQPGNKT